MYTIKEYFHGKFSDSYECDSLEEGKRIVGDLNHDPASPFSFKLFKDDKEIETGDPFPENVTEKPE